MTISSINVIVKTSGIQKEVVVSGKIQTVIRGKDFEITIPPLVSTSTMEEMSLALAEARASARVESVTITGEEECFSRGADLGEIARFFSLGSDKKQKDALYAFARRGQRLIIEIRDFPKEVVALVAGECLNGGFEIMLGCHRVIAARSARFGFLEYVEFGLMPFWGGSYFFVVRLAAKMREFAEQTNLCESLCMSSKEFRTIASAYAYGLLTTGQALNGAKMLQLRLADKLTYKPVFERPGPYPLKSFVSPSTAICVATILSNQENRKDPTNGDVLDEEDILEELAKIFADYCMFPEVQESIMGSR